VVGSRQDADQKKELLRGRTRRGGQLQNWETLAKPARLKDQQATNLTPPGNGGIKVGLGHRIIANKPQREKRKNAKGRPSGGERGKKHVRGERCR